MLSFLKHKKWNYEITCVVFLKCILNFRVRSFAFFLGPPFLFPHVKQTQLKKKKKQKTNQRKTVIFTEGCHSSEPQAFGCAWLLDHLLFATTRHWKSSGGGGAPTVTWSLLCTWSPGGPGVAGFSRCEARVRYNSQTPVKSALLTRSH